MSGEPDTRPAFQIGALHVEPSRNRLSRGDQHVAVEPRVMDVLCVLAEHGEEVTSRQQLISRLWPVEFGADEGLTRAISSLRRAIREAGGSDDYVETIPKRGYRLAQPVAPLDPAPPVTAPPRTPAPDLPTTAPLPEPMASQGERDGARTTKQPWVALAGVAGLLLLVALLWANFAGPGDTPAVIQPAADSDAPAAMTPPSIAVLPFRPLSDEPADVHFGDGIAEELQHLLERIPSLRVVGRTSALAMRDRSLATHEIGELLDADHIVEGSVRRYGDRLRVTAQLLRADNGEHLWSDTFDRDLSDVFAMQDEITLAIAQVLQVRLGSGVTDGLRISPDVDPRAIDLFYEALYLWSNRFTENDARGPFDALRAALAIDEDFAAAWALLGSFGVVADAGPAANDRKSYSALIRDAMDRALRLDPDNGLAHAAMAVWHLQTSHELERARYHLERAQAVQPNAFTTLTARMSFAWVLGDEQEALQLVRQLRQRDPLNRAIELQQASLLAQTGRFDEAFEFFDACQASRCLGAGFVTYASAAVFMSGDSARLEQWKPVAIEFLKALEQVPASRKPRSAELLPALFATWFGLPEQDAAVDAALALLERDPIYDHIGIWGPTLAAFAPQDLMMDLLELAYARGDLLSAPYAMAPFYGAHPYPRTLLAAPRYEALWQQPGLREIANQRRSAGHLHGLPADGEQAASSGR